MRQKEVNMHKGQWTNIARIGEFIAMNGERVRLTAELFDSVVANYKPEQHEAPLVFGHPKTNDPAYGWVSAVRRFGDFLQTQFKQVPKAVEKLIDSGAYKKISASFFRGNQLRHVGLLGATPPAIDGLGDIQLGAGDQYTTVEFAMEEFMDKDQKIKDLEAKLEAAETRAQKAEAELPLKEKVQAAETKATAAETERDKIAAEFATFREQQTQRDREARFDRLVEQGKAVPADKEKVLGFACALADSDRKLEFSSGESKPVEEAFWAELEAAKPNNLLAEFATSENAAGAADRNDDINAAEYAGKV